MKKIFPIALLVFPVLTAGILWVRNSRSDVEHTSNQITDIETFPQPTPIIFTQYEVPQIKSQPDYGIFLVGDSMTKALGPHPYVLSVRINKANPTKMFVIDNYSEGGKNVTSLPMLLNSEVNLDGRIEPAALKREVDILIIESFGHNPLSDLTLEEGKKLQEEILTQTMTEIIKNHPQTIVIFLATIGPSMEKYGDGLLNLAPQAKIDYVKERNAYIKNHIAYALKHNIPLINLYEKGRNIDGSVKLEYIQKENHLHPSQTGVEWIQNEIADFIINNSYLPQ